MAHFTHHEACPFCGSRDNMARYSDGSGWCFGCQNRIKPEVSGYVAEKQHSEDNRGVLPLPDDFCQEFSEAALEWISQYGIRAEELYQRGVGFSQRYNQLIFTFYQGSELIAWQGRNFNAGRSKYFTTGEKNNAPRTYLSVDHVRNGVRDGSESRRLVVVEDGLSAIKVARQRDSMPCLGCTLNPAMIASLRASYGFLDVWLDGNKMDEAQKIAQRASLVGIETRVIWTELDPKEYPDEQIKEYLQ